MFEQTPTWTEEEDEILKEIMREKLANNLSWPACAKLFNKSPYYKRSADSIRCRATRLGLVQSHHTQAPSAPSQTAPSEEDKEVDPQAPTQHDEETIRTILVMYAEVKYGGLDQSAQRIAIELCKQGYPISELEVKEILLARGQTKKSTPELDADPVKNAHMLLEMKKAIREKTFQTQVIRDLEQQLLDLKKQLQSKQTSTDVLKQLISPPYLDPNREGLEGRVLQGAMICPISDLHIGESIRFLPGQKKHSEYNKDMAYERARRWRLNIDRVLSACPSDMDVDTLWYMSLGDDFESLFGTMRLHQLARQDCHELEAWRQVIKIHIENIIHLCLWARTLGAKLVITFTPGNHDRLFGDRDYLSEEFIVTLMSEAILNHPDLQMYKQYIAHFACIPKVLSLTLDLQDGDKVVKTNVIAQHGHLSKVSSDKDIIAFKNLHGEKADRYVCIQGHLHHFKSLQVQDTLYVWNPSMTSSNDYALYQINASSRPGQIILTLNAKEDLIYGPFSLE